LIPNACQISKPNTQNSNNIQISNLKREIWDFFVNVWILFGIWIAIWNLSKPLACAGPTVVGCGEGVLAHEIQGRGASRGEVEIREARLALGMAVQSFNRFRDAADAAVPTLSRSRSLTASLMHSAFRTFAFRGCRFILPCPRFREQ
jgi:hypothetical protein